MQRDGLKLDHTRIVHEDWKAYYIMPIFTDEDGTYIEGEQAVVHKDTLCLH